MQYALVASAVASSLVLAAAGCHRSPDDALPAATDWQAVTVDPGNPLPTSRPPGMGGAESNPHAGVDMSGGGAGEGDSDGEAGDDPHAGVDMGGDPHAGVDMGGSNPHGGGDVTQLGLAAPDPNRSIDPRHHIAGTLTAGVKARAKVKPGTAVFLTVKRAAADGTPAGPPLAVDKLTWTGNGMAFRLTDEQAMVAGTDLSGEVVVSARYDQDGDALSKQPGDVTGQVRVSIPADNVVLVLDTVLP